MNPETVRPIALSLILKILILTLIPVLILSMSSCSSLGLGTGTLGTKSDLQPVVDGVIGMQKSYEQLERNFLGLVTYGEEHKMPVESVKMFRDEISADSVTFHDLVAGVVKSLNSISNDDFKEVLINEVHNAVGR